MYKVPKEDVKKVLEFVNINYDVLCNASGENIRIKVDLENGYIDQLCYCISGGQFRPQYLEELISRTKSHIVFLDSPIKIKDKNYYLHEIFPRILAYKHTAETKKMDELQKTINETRDLVIELMAKIDWQNDLKKESI